MPATIESTTCTFFDNLSFVEYEKLVRTLHLNNMNGVEASDDETMNDLFDKHWLNLNAQERERLNGLSADLYMIEGKENFESTNEDKESWFKELILELGREEHEKVLRRLRQDKNHLLPEHLAFLRWQSYRALGHYDSAVLFIEYAAKLNPQQDDFQVLKQQAYFEAGRKQQVIQYYADVFFRENISPLIKLMGVPYLFMLEDTRTNSVEFLSEVTKILENMLNNKSFLKQQSFKITRKMGYAFLASCYEKLGHWQRAHLAYQDALKLDPHDIFINQQLDRFNTSKKDRPKREPIELKHIQMYIDGSSRVVARQSESAFEAAYSAAS